MKIVSFSGNDLLTRFFSFPVYFPTLPIPTQLDALGERKDRAEAEPAALRPEPLGREEAKAKEQAGAGPGPAAEPSDAAPVEQLGEPEAVVRDEDGEVAGEAGRLNAARTAGLEAETGGLREEWDRREAAGGDDGATETRPEDDVESLRAELAEIRRAAESKDAELAARDAELADLRGRVEGRLRAREDEVLSLREELDSLRSKGDGRDGAAPPADGGAAGSLSRLRAEHARPSSRLSEMERRVDLTKWALERKAEER